jgi:hypothetical protein
MTTTQLLSVINDLEFKVAKLKAVQKEFPDAKINSYGQINCKTVNLKYTGLEFQADTWGLYVFPYCDVSFIFNGVTETTKVFSAPKRNKLVRNTWKKNAAGQRMMVFSRLAFNLKHNQFKEEMLAACQTEIMKFIANNPGFAIDDKHLDPRLKKLMSFI